MSLKDSIARLKLADVPQPDVATRVSAWQNHVDRLYDKVIEWLRPYIDAGDIIAQKDEQEAWEQLSGAYQIKRLDLEIGKETVRLAPRGTYVIGASGRVDISVLGTGDPVILITTDLGSDEAWQIVTRGKKTVLTPLNARSFEEVLESLLDEYGVAASFGA